MVATFMRRMHHPESSGLDGGVRARFGLAVASEVNKGLHPCGPSLSAGGGGPSPATDASEWVEFLPAEVPPSLIFYAHALLLS